MALEGEILKYYIEKHRLNKADVARVLGMSRQNLYQLFTSNTLNDETKSNLKTGLKVDFKKMVKEFNDNIDIPTPPELYVHKRRKLKANPDPYMVPLVPVKAQAGYVRAVDQSTYIDTLELYALPPGVNPAGAVWRYWEVEGDSMEPAFHGGDIILTSQVHPMDWENLRNFYLYVIVTADRVLFKRIYCKNGLEWVLISENEEGYPQQLLPVEQIKEVWVFRRSILAKAPPTKEFKINV